MDLPFTCSVCDSEKLQYEGHLPRRNIHLYGRGQFCMISLHDHLPPFGAMPSTPAADKVKMPWTGWLEPFGVFFPKTRDCATSIIMFLEATHRIPSPGSLWCHLADLFSEGHFACAVALSRISVRDRSSGGISVLRRTSALLDWQP